MAISPVVLSTEDMGPPGNMVFWRVHAVPFSTGKYVYKCNSYCGGVEAKPRSKTGRRCAVARGRERSLMS